MFAADERAGGAGDWRQAGVVGQAPGPSEGAALADVDEDPGSGPDPDARHGSQDRGKKVGLQRFVGPGREESALVQHGAEAGDETGDDQFGGIGAGDDHGLLVECSEDALDQARNDTAEMRAGCGRCRGIAVFKTELFFPSWVSGISGPRRTHRPGPGHILLEHPGISSAITKAYLYPQYWPGDTFRDLDPQQPLRTQKLSSCHHDHSNTWPRIRKLSHPHQPSLAF